MAKRNPNGWVRLDDIELEGGIVVKVSLDKEKGIFHARYDEHWKNGENEEHHGGKSWEGKDLEKIRNDVYIWAKEEKALKWEPVIAIWDADGYGGARHKVLGQQFDRLMRAKKHKGDDYEWRHWAFSAPDKNFIYDTDLEVYAPAAQTSEPSKFRSDENKPVIMEYSPEKWLALLKLVEMESALRDRFHEIVGSGKEKVEQLLEKIPTAGLLAFAPKPKGKS